MSPALRALLIAAEKLTRRLAVLQTLQMQARERGDTYVELHVAELFEPADLEAIQAWEAAKAEALGAQPLPFEAEPSRPTAERPSAIRTFFSGLSVGRSAVRP
jgi:hypothetical protein